MSDVRDHLERWRAAGLLDEAAAARIAAFEQARTHAREAAEGDARPGVLEAIVYLGVAVAVVGAYALFAQRWEELESWARLATVAAPLVAALAAGAAMQQVPEPGVRRGGEVAWLAAVALAAGTLAVAFQEYGDGSAGDRGGLLLNALATTLLALVLWALSPSHPQMIGVGGAIAFFGVALGNWPDDYDLRLAGMTMAVSGIVGVALVEAGLLRPRTSARFAFAALTAWGPYLAGLEGSVIWAELLVFVAGAAFGVLSIVRASFTYMVVGVAAIFAGLVTFLFEHFDQELGAPVALIISGAALIAAVLILSRVRGVVRQRRLAA